jgi:hypothetical protein
MSKTTFSDHAWSLNRLSPLAGSTAGPTSSPAARRALVRHRSM